MGSDYGTYPIFLGRYRLALARGQPNRNIRAFDRMYRKAIRALPRDDVNHNRRIVRDDSKVPGSSLRQNGKVRDDFELWNRVRNDGKLDQTGP